MKKVIALLRGINVGGHKKIPMAELRDLLSGNGFKEVTTYIQSGNILISTDRNDFNRLSSEMHSLIRDHFGFEVPVIIKTPEEIKLILENFPFESEKLEKSYFTILEDLPDTEIVEELSEIKYENEEFQFVGQCLYYFGEAGMGKAKFNHILFERKLKMAMTTRNYRTMMKLLSLSEE